MIFPLLPVFVASLGAAPAFLGLIEGIADAVSSLLKLAFGVVADRVRRNKPFVVAGYLVASIVRPTIAFATVPLQVLAVRVLDRVGKGIRTTPRDAILAGSVDRADAGRAFGFHRAMDHAGAVVGPLVASVLLACGWSIPHVFLATLVPNLITVVLVARMTEPPVNATDRVADATSSAPALPKRLRSYLAILTLFALGNSSDAFLLLRAQEIGVEVAYIPLLWAAFHVVKVVSSYLGGDASDRLPRANVIVAGWFVYAATYLSFGLASEPWHVVVSFLVYGVYYGLTEPAEKAFIKDLAPERARGRAYGAYNFLVGASAIPASLLTGLVWQRWGAGYALGVGAAAAAVASVALFVWSSVPGDARTQ